MEQIVDDIKEQENIIEEQSLEQNEEEANIENASSVELNASELNNSERAALIEALLFSCGEPLSVEQLSQVTSLDNESILFSIQKISDRLADDAAGIEIVCVADRYQLRTKPKYGGFIRKLKSGGPKKLSGPALETLSIVAYRQPIVKSDIEKIRGVDATPTIKTLLERNLICIVGHQATVGQPALYGTTQEFLELFGLSSLSQLPTLRDLNEIENDPGETSEETEEEDSIEIESTPVENSQEMI
jgi:segregation and condensation protein B